METPTQRSGTISPPVFYSSAILIAVLVLFASIFPSVVLYSGCCADFIEHHVSSL